MEDDLDKVDEMIKKTGCMEFHEKVQVINIHISQFKY